MSNFPRYLILPDKVYNLSVSKQINTPRAFSRGLIDFGIEGVNPLINSDRWRTTLGMSEELSADYASFENPIPVEWVLSRFLSHHVRTNSVHILSGPGGEVLTTTTVNDYLGKEIADEETEQILRVIFGYWVHVRPEENIELGDIYVSTDISIDKLKRGINHLKFLGHIEEIEQDIYRVKPGIFDKLPLLASSLDRKSNRYYQEIKIEANEPFCFVIMPFDEKEFPQKTYTEIIKPFIENNFQISCYRVDEDHLPDRIDNKIYSYLLRAVFIIAEVTTCNPNVLYELALAHEHGKDCITLTQEAVHKVPFDINRFRIEKYNDDKQLVDVLKRSISALGFRKKGGFEKIV